MNKLTPVLTVKSIEESLTFWVDKLAFTVTAEMPEGDKLGFVILQKGGVEVMLQTPTLAAEDLQAMTMKFQEGPAQLFIEVDDLDVVIEQLKDLPIVLGPRTMFYGMKEAGYIEPGGHFCMFAQRVAPEAS